MIKSFGNKATEDLFHGEASKETRRLPAELLKRACRLLDVIDQAHLLQDIEVYPGTRLEKKKGNLKDFFSIRVNEQYRILFQWKDNNAEQVQILDYH